MITSGGRSFSFPLYVAIVCALSWPFQLAFALFGASWRPILLISMVMVTIATYICGKFVFQDGFAEAGWSWGKPRHYLLAFGLALFLWLVPTLLGGSLITDPLTVLRTFALNFVITLIPAFGEEFGWRGYLLPRLLKMYSERKAVLIHGLVTWFWHLPVLVVMGLALEGNPVLAVGGLLLISIVPTVMHAVVFAYIWSVSKSIVVATVYHSAFDEVRDTLSDTVGLGPLAEVWQMGFLTLFGALALWKHRWGSKFA